MPLDHFFHQVPKSKVEDVVSFLTKSMAHMGFEEKWRPAPHVVGMGDTGKAYFWVVGVDPDTADGKTHESLLKKNHIAFYAADIEQVEKFHAVALEAGGIDEGAPGFRPKYHPSYYAAFVRDPACGVNFEVVNHDGMAS